MSSNICWSEHNKEFDQQPKISYLISELHYLLILQEEQKAIDLLPGYIALL